MGLGDIFNLSGKTAVIFGGNGYLGNHICHALLEFGSKVYSCDKQIDDHKSEHAYKRNFDSFYPILLDASDKNELIFLREQILKKEKRVDILINCITEKSDDFYLPFENVSLDGWNVGLLGNLTIPFLTIQAFIETMKQHRSGSIINIASVYGLVGNDQRMYEGCNLSGVYLKNATSNNRVYSHGVYNASKAGLINLTRYLATYYGGFNIRVNSISPGGVYNENEDEEFLRKYSDKVPLGRKAMPDEINGAVIYLASDASSYVTGHNLIVDGGFTAW